MWEHSKKLVKAILEQDWARGLQVEEDFWDRVINWVEEYFLPCFLEQFAKQIDEIIEINPELPDPEILTRVTKSMVEFLGAHSATARIYDPHTEEMLSYGSYPYWEGTREVSIPLEGTVAGEVIKKRKTYIVPNILEEDLYKHKGVIKQKEVNSMMAIPLEIPRFFPHERDIVGVIQIYYPENNRNFSSLEIQFAEVMSRRLSYVIARKKILSLYRINEKKEAIVRKIFQKLGAKEGVKMKDIFNSMIPELADIINIQSCALFAVADNLTHVILEAGYPEKKGYHSIGKSFKISDEPVFEIILNRKDTDGESPYEIITPSYILVIDPQKSNIISQHVKKFAQKHKINSILYIPLTMGEEVTHFMTFDALDYRQRYTDEEIEVLVFMGRELMKAQRMERLDDILHDFKNPAIATAGFARRLKQLLDQKGTRKDDPKIKRYLNILIEETSRLQEMALSLYQIGKERVINLTEVLKNRFEINQEAIKEQLKANVVLKEGPFKDPLYVKCYPIHLERVLDNLLNNATNAIPIKGGVLSIKTYQKDNWACAEITNTGIISEEERLRLLEGEGSGRGIYITYRIVRLLKGQIDINVGKETTTIIVKLPVSEPSPPDNAKMEN